jgi:hypothetical protein
MTGILMPTWAPRLKQHQIRRLYESDARGMLDEALLDEVGWGLRARCQSFLQAVEAVHGRVHCPACDAVILRSKDPDEALLCPGCGWECPWKTYHKTFQHKQLNGAEPVLSLFRDYLERFPLAREPQAKMLLIDRIITGFHHYLRFGDTRATAVNLIEGSYHDVVDFLDSLSAGPGSTPGIQENHAEWREKINRTADLWNDEQLRRF